jgi:cholesterol oxidase
METHKYDESRRRFLGQSALTVASLLGLTTINLASCTKQELENSAAVDVNDTTVRERSLVDENYYPAIIIGTGYGGSVAALRLAQKGVQTLMLEMGMSWSTKNGARPFCKTSFILADQRSSWLKNTPVSPIPIPKIIQKFTGVLDAVEFPNMKVLAGRGVGGGSLVNGGMAIVPDKNWIASQLPSINVDEFFSKYIPLANQKLKSNMIPLNFYKSTPYYQFSRVGEQDAVNAGYQVALRPNVYDFEYMLKEAAGQVVKSALGSEVIYGNNAGKNSLDKTYLAEALGTGKVTIKTLSRVDDIFSLPQGGYKINVSQLNTSGTVVATKVFTCKHLIMAAGSMGTNQLLVKARETKTLPNLNAEVGKNWGSNASVSTARAFTNPTGFVQSTIPVKAIDNWNNPINPFNAEIGPLPIGIETFLNNFLVHSKSTERGYFKYNTLTKQAELVWGKYQSAPSIMVAQRFMEQMSRANGGIVAYILNNGGYNGSLTYHPLGGCLLDKATDNYGRVKGYQNLYITDASLLPGVLGVNPFVTITSMAERNMERIIAEDFV